MSGNGRPTSNMMMMMMIMRTYLYDVKRISYGATLVVETNLYDLLFSTVLFSFLRAAKMGDGHHGFLGGCERLHDEGLPQHSYHADGEAP